MLFSLYNYGVLWVSEWHMVQWRRVQGMESNLTISWLCFLKKINRLIFECSIVSIDSFNWLHQWVTWQIKTCILCKNCFVNRKGLRKSLLSEYLEKSWFKYKVGCVQSHTSLCRYSKDTSAYGACAFFVDYDDISYGYFFYFNILK